MTKTIYLQLTPEARDILLYALGYAMGAGAVRISATTEALVQQLKVAGDGGPL